jgi:hypothetical protein
MNETSILFDISMLMAVCRSCPFFNPQQLKAISEAGVNVIVSGGKVGDLAEHYCNKYKVMVIRLLSKWDLRRLCKSIGATALPKIVSRLCVKMIVHAVFNACLVKAQASMLGVKKSFET